MMGVIEIDLFPPDVDDLNHPAVDQFKEMLEMTAEEYDCRLLTFEIEHGTVSFSFDNEELTSQILKILQIE
ncbi:hypothetical protein ACFL9T_16650 [Thermodesulfobacteriota bacterium]